MSFWKDQQIAVFFGQNKYLKGAMSRYFELFSATCKITFNVRETTKYLFSKIDKHQNGKNKAKRNADG